MDTKIVGDYLPRPVLKHAPDMSLVQKLSEDYLDEIGGRPPIHAEALENDIFEYTMMALYGEDVFRYINAKLR